MKTIPLLFVAWIITGASAVLGSVLGRSFGRSGLLWGAITGGVVGVCIAAVLGGALGWLPARDRSGAIAGGIVGFALATPLVLTTLDTPVIPILGCGLTGIIMLLGVGIARGLRGEQASDE